MQISCVFEKKSFLLNTQLISYLYYRIANHSYLCADLPERSTVEYVRCVARFDHHCGWMVISVQFDGITFPFIYLFLFGMF
jgi:hypothetical protein